MCKDNTASTNAKQKLINLLRDDNAFVLGTEIPVIDPIRFKRTHVFTSGSSGSISFEKNSTVHATDSFMLPGQKLVPYGMIVKIHKVANGELIPGSIGYSYADKLAFPTAAEQEAIREFFNSTFNLSSGRDLLWEGRAMSQFQIVPQQQLEADVEAESNGCNACCPIDNDYALLEEDNNALTFYLPDGAIDALAANDLAVTFEICSQIYRGTNAEVKSCVVSL